MKKKIIWISVLCLVAVLAFGACSSSDINGTWIDPVTGNTLNMSKGNFTLTDPGGTQVSAGTYDVATESDTYDVTLSDGTTGTVTVEDTTVMFTNSATGEVTVYESQTTQ